jgi:tetratricopeptide (TPR) repeat protein
VLFAFCVCVAPVAGLFRGVGALAAEPAARPAAGNADGGNSERYDPQNISAISQSMEALAKGNERIEAKDTTAAIDHYRRGIQLAPKNPYAHYLLAEAQIVAGQLGEAEAAISEAQQYTDARNPQLRARVLFAAADIYEREKKWDQAKAVWQQYADYAAKLGGDGGMFPQSAAERLKSIQKVLEMEKAYVAVRERIAADKASKADAGSKK